MTTARNAILSRLTHVPQQSSRARQHVSLPVLTREADAATTPIEQFGAALERIGVTWEVADNPVSARLYLATALQADAITRVLTWDPAHLPAPGLLDTMNVLGIETTIPDLRAAPPRLRPQDPDSRGDLLRALAAVEVGIVAADAGFEDTGAIALRGGEGRPLLAVCLPRRVVVLLPASKVFPSLSHWPASETAQAGAVTTFLAGPSQSLDLELIRAAGIHGPRLVHVVLVGESV